MEQIYLLSIVVNLIAGLSLSAGNLGERAEILAVFNWFRENKRAEIVLGVLAAATGVLKLIIKSPDETVPVAGDLLPGLIGIAMSVVLIMDAFQKVEAGGDTAVKGKPVLLGYTTHIGVTGLVISVLHFLFPGVLIL